MKTQRIVSVAALAVVAIIAAGLVWKLVMDWQSLATTTTTSPQVDQSADTLKQVAGALLIAQRDNKRVLLQFGSRGCS
jgi:hypothetical protein